MPVTNLTRILETITQNAHKVKNPVDLADCVRQQLGRDILERFLSDDGKVAAMVLDPRLESKLRDGVHDRTLSLLPGPLEQLIGRLNEQWQKATVDGRDIVLLTDGTLRRPLRQAIGRALPEMSVVAYHEIPNDVLINFQHMLKLEDVFADVTTSDTSFQQTTEKELVTTA